jgi:hypothetical protein
MEKVNQHFSIIWGSLTPQEQKKIFFSITSDGVLSAFSTLKPETTLYFGLDEEVADALARIREYLK